VDTQIVDEAQLEDLNGILNTGDVPNLYEKEDIEEISDQCRADCIKKQIQQTPMNIFMQYLVRVKSMIHCVICMSPMGDIFSDRLRRFPSLVNCCTIDWYSNWPAEALAGVGQG
jgi:dynein heavy chain